MARKASNKTWRVTACGPRWGREDIDGMVVAIECHQGLAEKCDVLLVESRRELEAIEDKLRREKFLRSDRQLMLDEVKLRLSWLSDEELPLHCSVEEKNRALAVLESNSPLTCEALAVELRRDIAALTTKKEGLAFRKASDEVTVRLCGEAIAGCTDEINDLQCSLETSTERNARTECRVSSLRSSLVSMREQLSRMQVGEGVALFPLPLQSSPQEPVIENHTLNACPVCSMWFECYDYASLSCGHTYHPFCLHEYAQKANKCLVPCCDEPFGSKNLAALGIRPTSVPEAKKDQLRGVKEEVTAVKSSQKTISGEFLSMT